MLEAALLYAAAGWPVFPLAGKVPRTPHGVYNASADGHVIRAWWRRWPNANIGLPTGKLIGAWVLDVDPRHGGDRELAMLEAEHSALPDTPRSRTGRGDGGGHILFALPEAPARWRGHL